MGLSNSSFFNDFTIENLKFFPETSYTEYFYNHYFMISDSFDGSLLIAQCNNLGGFVVKDVFFFLNLPEKGGGVSVRNRNRNRRLFIFLA
jgi:hypothetical protein